MFRQTCNAAIAVLATTGWVGFATAEEPGEAAAKKQITNSIGMMLTLIPAGEFMMGSGESAAATAEFFNKSYGGGRKEESFTCEHPQHRVRITRPFYLGTHPVTRGQFRQFVDDTDYTADAEKEERRGAFGWHPDEKKFMFSEKYSWRKVGFEQTDEHPVVNVTWHDAVTFCRWLSEKDGKTYRLPTEAEWKYACRARTTTRYYSGDDPETLAKVGNVADATAVAKFPRWKNHVIKASDGHVFTSPVGSFRPNTFGLYDMHGNVLEWCADRWSANYYATSPTDDPTGPASGTGRVVRGCPWNGRPEFARSSSRLEGEPGGADDYGGFRVAKTP